jgi:Gpi18-like mannosyltransferase
MITINLWKPYEMYCLSRLDTSYFVPKWCWDTYPNLYSYIQKEYWDVGFGGFLDRPWYLTATSMFTNQLFFYILYRTIIDHNPLHFFTMGLFVGQKKPQSIFESN